MEGLLETAGGNEINPSFFNIDEEPLMPGEEGTEELSDDDSWADCIPFEADGLDLDYTGINWDLNGGLDQDPSLEEHQLDEVMIATGIKQSETETQHLSVPPIVKPIPPEGSGLDHVEVPAFTPQDEISELATLTDPEIQGILSDLHGITVGVDNLRVDDLKTTPRPAILSRFEDEVYKLPAERKAAYCQAVIKCPGLVNDKRKMAFLEREDGNPGLAAVRLALYWELRLEIFGPERCFLPMTLNGAMRGEVENMVRWPMHHLLPIKDTAGRAIWYADPSIRDLEKYSVEQENMAFWYLLEVTMEDPEVLKRGFVFVSNLKNFERQHYRRKKGDLPSGLRLRIFERAMPIHLRAGHHCNPSIFVYCLLPAFLHIFGRNYRQRTQLHRGSDSKILKDLEHFCLPRDRLPMELGGDVVLDMAKFLANRMVVESSRPDPRLAVDQKPIIISQGPATKRSRTDSVTTDDLDGRKSDPRMLRAIDIRLANPEVPLINVLLKAGYTFDLKNAKGEAVDADNVTLKQRRNNLCRRVRQEKAKLEEQGAGPTESQQGSGQDSATVSIVPDTAFSAIPRSLEAEVDVATAGTNAWLESTRGKPDPRMTLAVDIRLANLDMPLHDVLLKAGYTFDFNDEDGEPIGPDKISLSQRKNNLCRRVRQEKLKREAQQQDNADESDNSVSIVPSAETTQRRAGTSKVIS